MHRELSFQDKLTQANCQENQVPEPLPRTLHKSPVQSLDICKTPTDPSNPYDLAPRDSAASGLARPGHPQVLGTYCVPGTLLSVIPIPSSIIQQPF